jgi:hypothetical protein
LIKSPLVIARRTVLGLTPVKKWILEMVRGCPSRITRKIFSSAVGLAMGTCQTYLTLFCLARRNGDFGRVHLEFLEAFRAGVGFPGQPNVESGASVP